MRADCRKPGTSCAPKEEVFRAGHFDRAQVAGSITSPILNLDEAIGHIPIY